MNDFDYKQTATSCNTLHHTTTLRKLTLHTATDCNRLQQTATDCNTASSNCNTQRETQRKLTHQSEHSDNFFCLCHYITTLHHTATNCNTPQYTENTQLSHSNTQEGNSLIKLRIFFVYDLDGNRRAALLFVSVIVCGCVSVCVHGY